MSIFPSDSTAGCHLWQPSLQPLQNSPLLSWCSLIFRGWRLPFALRLIADQDRLQMHAPTLAAATPRNFSIAGLPIPVQDNAAQVLLETAAACKQQYTHSRHNCDAVCPLNSECSQASGAVLACCNPANVQPNTALHDCILYLPQYL